MKTIVDELDEIICFEVAALAIFICIDIARRIVLYVGAIPV